MADLGQLKNASHLARHDITATAPRQALTPFVSLLSSFRGCVCGRPQGTACRGCRGPLTPTYRCDGIAKSKLCLVGSGFKPICCELDAGVADLASMVVNLIRGGG
jgi:hypothetical protein